ncbi:MAG: hypothetical protein ACERKS_10355 [Candidatus Bathyarchaeota archaeon]|jgi:hypothetical protein
MRQTFSAVLDSKKQVKNITLSDNVNQKVFFEADIGQLEEVKFTEGLLLEVVGTKGVLRIDLPVETLRKVVEKTR